MGLAKALTEHVSLQIYELEDVPSEREIYIIQREDSSLKELSLGREFEKALELCLEKR